MPKKPEEKGNVFSRRAQNGDVKTGIVRKAKYTFGVILTILSVFLLKPALTLIGGFLATTSAVITICESKSAAKIIVSACNHFMPVEQVSPCETAQHYQEYKNAGATALIKYINECSAYNTSYLIDAKSSLEQIEYSDIRACIFKTCHATACLDKQNHLSVERIDMLSSQAREQENSASCHSVSVPSPPSVPAPSVPADPEVAAKKQQLALADWSNQGLNASNKARLPIAILASRASYDDERAASDLSAMLGKIFHLVNKSEAALSIDVSNMHLQTDISGRPCTNPSDEAEHIGRASLSIRAVWTSDGRTMLSERPISASAQSCKTADAAKAARDQLLQNVKEFLVALANQTR